MVLDLKRLYEIRQKNSNFREVQPRFTKPMFTEMSIMILLLYYFKAS